MRNSRFREEQIVGIIQEYSAGAKVSELCRQHGMSDATFYKWKAKYGDMQVCEVKRLKELEDGITRTHYLIPNFRPRLPFSLCAATIRCFAI